MAGAPLRVLGERDDLAPALIDAEHRQWRKQDRYREQKWRRPLEKRLQPQPEIKPDTAVGPGHGKKDVLHRDHERARDPIAEQYRRIVWWTTPVQRSPESRACQMKSDQKRNT